MDNPIAFVLFMSITVMCISALAVTRWPAAELVFTAAAMAFFAWCAVVMLIAVISYI
jgi:hypothetical protein